MTDPHVESLVYRAESAEDIIYDDPPPVEIGTDRWDGCLENGILTCRMKTHYASVSDARTEIESYLRAWEVNANLKHGKGSIKFVYQDANVIDLSPQETGRGVVVCPKAAVMGAGTMTASVQIIRRTYPPAPKDFMVSPDVETLWGRYEGYLNGKEKLPAMAYFCLTVIVVIYGQGKKGVQARQEASRTLEVDFDVLDTLGKLTSTRGDRTMARKFLAQSLPLTKTECAWIEAVMKALIHRVGEYEYNNCGDCSRLTEITMADFPYLE
jgi:hypothetical protein